MARIRSIKPEFWSSEQIMECSPNARLAFVGLWNFCDDVGRHPFAPKQIKALIFPGDDFTAAEVEAMLIELQRNRLISVYAVDGRRYLQVTGWHHQKIDKPQPARFPAQISETAQLPFDDHSANGIEGRDRRGGEGRGSLGADGSVEPSPPRAAAVRKRAELDQIEAACRAAAGLEDSPAPRLCDLRPILAFLDAGRDLERDVLPVLRQHSGREVASWEYFTKGLQRGAEVADRAAALAAQPPDAPKPRRGQRGYVSAETRAWLAEGSKDLAS